MHGIPSGSAAIGRHALVLMAAAIAASGSSGGRHVLVADAIPHSALRYVAVAEQSIQASMHQRLRL